MGREGLPRSGKVLLGVMNVFINLLVMMGSWVKYMPKLIELCTLTM